MPMRPMPDIVHSIDAVFTPKVFEVAHSVKLAHLETLPRYALCCAADMVRKSASAYNHKNNVLAPCFPVTPKLASEPNSPFG